MAILCSQGLLASASITDIFGDQGFYLFYFFVVVSGVRKSESAGFVFMKSEDQTAQLPGCTLALPTLLCPVTGLGLWTFWVQGLSLMLRVLFPEMVLVCGSV